MLLKELQCNICCVMQTTYGQRRCTKACRPPAERCGRYLHLCVHEESVKTKKHAPYDSTRYYQIPGIRYRVSYLVYQIPGEVQRGCAGGLDGRRSPVRVMPTILTSLWRRISPRVVILFATLPKDNESDVQIQMVRIFGHILVFDTRMTAAQLLL